MFEAVIRWSVVASLLTPMAVVGCSKKDTGAGSATAETTAAQPADAPSQKEREDTLAGNAAKAIPANGADPAEPMKVPARRDDADKQVVAAAAGQTVADTQSYVVTVNAPAAAAGKDASLDLTVTPKSGWKLNVEFPTKVTLKAPADVTLSKDTLAKADAKVFKEHEGATWPVGFKASAAGAKAFTGQLKFAVCTATTCDPKIAKLAFSVQVE